MLEFVTHLQHLIIQGLEAFEPTSRFVLKPWQKPEKATLSGHGVTALLQGGDVFEKFGVNISHVSGQFSPAFRKEIPGADVSQGQFWACGLSLVGHPRNPHVPAVHMNVRRIQTSHAWFGGGMDLTPARPYAEDTQHFHHTCQQACQIMGPDAYAHYRQWCQTYFHLPHRNEERGVGGIFYDNLSTEDPRHWQLTQAVGQAFLAAYTPLVQRRKDQPATAEDYAALLHKRGRYVEFNLLYDRGTRFGLQTGGNPEAILMSLPPLAAW